MKTKADLQKRIEELESALRYYTESTIVSSWGMQWLDDDGAVARAALGLPEPDAHELNMRLTGFCTCDQCQKEQEEESYS